VLFSCAQVDKSGNEVFRQKVRHGVVPLPLSREQKFKASQFEHGKSLYRTHCLVCHGEKGLGDGSAGASLSPRPANLQQLVKEVRDFKFYMSISQWQGEMPGWKEPLSEADREDLVIYLKSFR